MATEGLAHDPNRLHGNVMAGVDIVDDGARFVFHMRESMKFSDDSAFRHNDLRMNQGITPPPDDLVRRWMANLWPRRSLKIAPLKSFHGTPREFPKPADLWHVPFVTDSGYLKRFHGDYTDMGTLNPMNAEGGAF